VSFGVFFFTNRCLRPHTLRISIISSQPDPAGLLRQDFLLQRQVDPLAEVTPPPFNAIGGNMDPSLALGPVAPPAPAMHAPSHAPNGEKDCVCGKAFTRKSSLTRHIKTAIAQELRMLPQSPLPNLSPGPSSIGLECGYCTKYLGLNAFARRDNLRQHLLRSHGKTKDEIRDYLQRYDGLMAQSRFQGSLGNEVMWSR